MRVALLFLVKNRGAKRPGFSIEFEMVRFTILHRVYLNGLPVNSRDLRLPEKQVIRNRAIKKLRNGVECFFVAEWRGASRCEWSEGGGRRKHEATSASDAY
ncbi:MAG: hypothetical protein BGO34_22110 [Bacteroidia bacterium 44-10]|nr:MAG: hypothetical protein BGO34_22110 [Bacteroidia bacterium 44-10]